MSVESTEALERSVLEGKDREQLLAIATALGVKATSRAKKADIIAKILEQTGGSSAAESPAPAPAAESGAETAPPAPAELAPAEPAAPQDPRTEPMAEWELAVGAEVEGDAATDGTATATEPAPPAAPAPGNRTSPYPPSTEGTDGTGTSNRRRRRRNRD